MRGMEASEYVTGKGGGLEGRGTLGGRGSVIELCAYLLADLRTSGLMKERE
jgi:hypothetical protein